MVLPILRHRMRACAVRTTSNAIVTSKLTRETESCHLAEPVVDAFYMIYRSSRRNFQQIIQIVFALASANSKFNKPKEQSLLITFLIVNLF